MKISIWVGQSRFIPIFMKNEEGYIITLKVYFPGY